MDAIICNGCLFQKGTGKLKKSADELGLGKMIDAIINEIVVVA